MKNTAGGKKRICVKGAYSHVGNGDVTCGGGGGRGNNGGQNEIFMSDLSESEQSTDNNSFNGSVSNSPVYIMGRGSISNHTSGMKGREKKTGDEGGGVGNNEPLDPMVVASDVMRKQGWKVSFRSALEGGLGGEEEERRGLERSDIKISCYALLRHTAHHFKLKLTHECHL